MLCVMIPVRHETVSGQTENLETSEITEITEIQEKALEQSY